MRTRTLVRVLTASECDGVRLHPNLMKLFPTGRERCNGRSWTVPGAGNSSSTVTPTLSWCYASAAGDLH